MVPRGPLVRCVMVQPTTTRVIRWILSSGENTFHKNEVLVRSFVWSCRETKLGNRRYFYLIYSFYIILIFLSCYPDYLFYLYVMLLYFIRIKTILLLLNESLVFINRNASEE
jgi:hypothetical protein